MNFVGPQRMMGDKIIPMCNGSFLVSVVFRPDDADEVSDLNVVLDIHSSDWSLVKSTRRNAPFLPRCFDSKNRLYAIEHRSHEGREFPVLVRYFID